MSQRHGWDIRTRMLAISLGPALLLTLLLTAYFTYSRLQDLRQELTHTGQLIADQLAPAAEYGVIAGNTPVLQKLLQATLDTPHVRFIEVRDRNDNILVYVEQLPGALQNAAPIDIFHSTIQRQRIALASDPLLDGASEGDGQSGEDYLGRVVVGMSNDAFSQRQQEILLKAALLAAFALLSGAPWPGSARLAGHVAVAGLLVHGLYLGGVFLAIEHGMSAGLTSLLVGLQPLATAALAGIWLGEQVSRRQWLGLALGLAGVALVVLGRIHGGADGLAWAAVLVALAAITCGTLYQKRFCGGMDLRTGGVVQYLASGALLGLAALLFESREVQWSTPFVLTLGWLVLGLSFGAVGLLYTLIRHGAASKVASLFYLVPPVTALASWLLFDERLAPAAIGGMLLVMLGVALVNWPGRRA